MNSIVIPAKRMCTVCDCENMVEALSCKGCGATFQFGLKDNPHFGTSFDSISEWHRNNTDPKVRGEKQFREEFLGEFIPDDQA